MNSSSHQHAIYTANCTVPFSAGNITATAAHATAVDPRPLTPVAVADRGMEMRLAL